MEKIADKNYWSISGFAWHLHTKSSSFPGLMIVPILLWCSDDGPYIVANLPKLKKNPFPSKAVLPSVVFFPSWRDLSRYIMSIEWLWGQSLMMVYILLFETYLCHGRGNCRSLYLKGWFCFFNLLNQYYNQFCYLLNFSNPVLSSWQWVG